MSGKLAHRTFEVDGEKRSSFEIVLAGLGAKLQSAIRRGGTGRTS
jgi:hypothetical protein